MCLKRNILWNFVAGPMVFERTVSPRTGGLWKKFYQIMCSKLIWVAANSFQIFYFEHEKDELFLKIIRLTKAQISWDFLIKYE